VKEHLGISYGVQVSGLTKGKFSENGIKDGFIILEINGEQVSTSDDVESIFDSLMKEENTDRVMFIRGIYPTGKKEYYAVDLNDE
jgi:type II secretory pathway component PulC